MSSLSRTNWVAQQRVDLHHLLASESYTAFDFRALITAFTGDKPFVLRGFEVIGKTGLAITITVSDTLTFNPLDSNGSFYKGLSTDTDLIIDMPADQQNLFVEARFINTSKAPINTAYWDPLALTGEDVAGTEYSASANSQVLMVCVITVNTIGFSEDSTPILRATTDGSNVISMVDCRPLFFRLGSGGTTPDASHKFPWGNSRMDPVASGSGVGDATNSPFRAKDPSGIVNDKGLRTFKDWADAVMTRISEVAGSSLWYATDSSPNNPLYGYITGLDLPRIFLDSEAGHSIQPSENVSLKWERQDPTQPISGSNKLVLKSFGQNGVDNISTVKWQTNYGPVTWEVGGVFLNNVPGGSRTYSDCKFVTPAMADGGNLYLLLERDIVPPLASGNAVKWASNSSYTGFNALKTVSGVAGDFIGIAVGDWVKKASEGFSQYYKVVRLTNGTLAGIRSNIGDVADATTVAVELNASIATGLATEAMTYFRSRYSQADFVVDAVAGIYNYKDSNYYWIGRRIGSTFILRGYGNMQEGEETLVKEDASMAGGHTGGGSGGSDVTLQHAYGAVYNNVSGYSLRAGGPTLITIRRRKRDNTIAFPGPTDNSGASLVYTIATPVGLMNDGDGLWVRLSDVVGGALTNGSVTNASDDAQNIDTTSNLWEVRTPANNPVRDFDNKDVMLIARRITLANGDHGLLFVDGTVLNPYGTVIDGYFEVMNDSRMRADVYLATKTPKSVLFIDQNTDPFAGQGRIDEDNVSFSYNKALKELTMFNNIFGINYHNLINPTDQFWFTNLGPHSLYLGGALSDIVIPGNLTVLGSETIVTTNNVAIADKNIILGIGNRLYGGGGSGLSIADNTLDYASTPNALTQLQSYAGQVYVDVTYTSDPGYVLQQIVGLASNFQFDQITEAAASQAYKVVAVGAVSGDLQKISPTVWRFWTAGTALAGAIQTTDAAHSYQTYDLLSEIHLGSSADDPTFMTSWAFGVKRNPNNVQPGNEGTVHAIVTPFESAALAQDFKTIPTSRQANFSRQRIPYAWEDGVGPSGSDTTFDFTDRLTWDYNTNTFRIYGTLQIKGNIVPEDDNTWDIGTTALRWKTVHVGPGSFISHNDNTNTDWVSLGFWAGNAALATSGTVGLWLQGGPALNQWFLASTGRASFSGSVSASTLMAIGQGSGDAPVSGIDQFGISLSTRLTGTNSSNQLSIRGYLAGTIARATQVLLRTPSIVYGTTTEHMNILIEDVTSGSITNSFGLYSLISSGTNKWFVYGSGDAVSYLAGGLGIGNNNQTNINVQRLVLGTLADTTIAGGMNFGTDIPVYRYGAASLRIGSKLRVDDAVGIGTYPSASYSLYVRQVANQVGQANIAGVKVLLTGDVATTGSIYGNDVTLFTANFGSLTTVTDVISFVSNGGWQGTNATITNNIGFLSYDFIDGTNKIAFASKMSSGVNKWGLYFDGYANNYLAGSLGIGSNDQTALNSHRLVIGTTSDMTSAGGIQVGGDINIYREAANAILFDSKTRFTKYVTIGNPFLTNADSALTIIGILPSYGANIQNKGVSAFVTSTTVATSMAGFYAQMRPDGASTMTSVISFNADTPVLSGGTIASIIGFNAADFTSMSGINFAAGIQSLITAATKKWNLYISGNATNYIAGGVGIGNNTQATIGVQRLLIGVSTDSTPAGGINFGTDVNLYRSASGVLKTDTNLFVGSTLTVGAAAVTSSLGVNIQDPNISGANLTLARLTLQNEPVSGGSSSVTGVQVDFGFQDSISPLTIPSLSHFKVGTFTLYNQTSVTNMYGFNFSIAAPTFTGSATVTNIYAVYSALNSAANRWFLYGAGSALSYFAGNVGIGNNTQATLATARLTIGTAADTTSVGGMLFGGGLSNIYRSAADTLKTDGNFVVGGSMTFSGGTSFGGALNLNYAAVVNTNYAVPASDCVIPVNSTGGAVTVTLTAVTADQKGRLVVVKDVGGQAGQTGKAITITPNGANKIDGVTTSIVIDGERYSFTMICNGVDGWDII